MAVGTNQGVAGLAVYAVYAVSSLDTGVPLRHRTRQSRRDVRLLCQQGAVRVSVSHFRAAHDNHVHMAFRAAMRIAPAIRSTVPFMGTPESSLLLRRWASQAKVMDHLPPRGPALQAKVMDKVQWPRSAL